jgi:hypothetical protein
MPYLKSFWFTFMLLSVMATGCNSSEGKESHPKYENLKGARKGMNTHNIGRFSFSIPAQMLPEVHTARIRDIEVSEFQWPNGSSTEASRASAWDDNLNAITKLKKPHGIKEIIIEQRCLNLSNLWSKAVFYYGNSALDDEGFWDVLLDAGGTGVWLKYNGLLKAREEMLQWVSAVAMAYHETKEGSLSQNSPGNFFYLKYGALNIPYKHQEKSYARFKDPSLVLDLGIEMRETHKVEPKDEGLLARTAAVIATGYATGVDVKRLRSKKRTVAGLEGEEEVDRMRDKYRTAISFGWRYAGKKDSGEHPEIVIRMESPDGKLEEKLKVWDAILDSIKPLYKQ